MLRAYGEATRKSYQELGRAEARAEIIMSIAHALEDLELDGNTRQNLQKIFLVRTAHLLGLKVDQLVDLVSEWEDGSERKANGFRVISYDQPRGCAAAYYPETNPLIPLDSTAIGSNCPTSKSVIVRLIPAEQTPGGAIAGAGGSLGKDEGHKSRVAPNQLS